MLNSIATGDESWVHHTIPNQSMFQCNGSISFHLQPKSLRLHLLCFGDSQGVLLAHFQKHGENVNSALCCKVLLKFRDAIRKKKKKKVQSYCFIMTMQHRNYSGHFLNICLTAWTWPLPTSLFGPPKNHIGGKHFADDEVVTKVQTSLRQQLKDFYATSFYSMVKQVYQYWWRICQ
jgi:hypothetical protein